ncbi:MAG TPA: hypothetical protein VFL47_11060, partial [Flavisolibacter sp.]|nr:hypothetical protein [Flavisolibacter sp.]
MNRQSPQALTFLLSCFFVVVTAFSCQKDGSDSGGGNNGGNNGGNGGGGVTQPPAASEMDFYLTTGNQSALLDKQNTSLVFGTASNLNPVISVDTSQTFQTVDGFGFTLTDASAALISGLPATTQANLLKELFARDSGCIGISYLRVSIGASDLSAAVYTYDDLPAGETDLSLQHFSLRKDQSEVVPLLKKILAINPG